MELFRYMITRSSTKIAYFVCLLCWIILCIDAQDVQGIKEYLKNDDGMHDDENDGSIVVTTKRRRTSSIQTTFVVDEERLESAIYNSTTLIYFANDILLNDTVEIIGITGLTINGRNFKLDGQNKVTCLSISNYSSVTITNLTITRGYLSLERAAGAVKAPLFVSRSTAYISNCIVSNHLTYAPYGNVYGLYATLHLSETIISNNFAGDEYTGKGGVIMYYSTATITDCIISNNTGAFGGLVISYDSAAVVMFTTFHKNTGWIGPGAGMLVAFDSYVISQDNVYSNNTGDFGGGLVCFGANLESIGDTIVGNFAASKGGGLMFWTCDSFEGKDLTVTENTAVIGGGGIRIGYNSVAAIENFKVFGNVALQGGGVYADGGAAVLTNGEIYDNRGESPTFDIVSTPSQGNCTSIGGCIYSTNYPSYITSPETCIFEVRGSGEVDVTIAAVVNDGFINVSGVTYLLNTWMWETEPSLSNGDIVYYHSDNTEGKTGAGLEVCFVDSGEGGGVYQSTGTLELSNIDIHSNSATRYGGGIALNGGIMDLTSIDLWDNIADLEGLDVYHTGGYFSAIELTIPNINSESLGGPSILAALCVSSCAPGQSGNCNVTDAASGCYVNCGCNDCLAGTSFGMNGSTSPDDCGECSSGKHSSAKSSECTTCASGLFASDSTEDVGGGLKKQVFSGAISCNECPPGYFTNSTATIVCQACDAGRWSSSGASSCRACPVGKYSNNAADSCIACEPGKYASASRSTVCDSCAILEYSSNASNVCDQAVPDYFVLDSEIHECPKVGVDCFGEYYLPIPNKKYWIHRTEAAHTKKPMRCGRNTCTGSKKSACWTEGGFDDCDDDDELMCNKGATGPICGSCKDHFTYSRVSLQCEPCDSITFINLILLAIPFLGALLMYMFSNEFDHFYHDISEKWVVMMCKYATKTGMLNVIFVTYQILQSITYSMEIDYPYPFNDLLKGFGFLAMDFPEIDCTGISFFNKVYLFSGIPVAVALAIIAIGFLRAYRGAEDYEVIESQHSWALILWSYLILPPIANIQLNAFECISLSSDGSKYLRTDTSVDCESDEYQTFLVINSLFTTLYLSIPLVWLVLLWANRGLLFPDGITDRSMIVESRETHLSLKCLTFLFDRYHPQMAYWEVYEIFRRILFIGIVPLLSSSIITRSIIGIMFSIASSMFTREMSPYWCSSTNSLAVIAEVCIVLTYLGSLSLETVVNSDNVSIGILFCLVLLSVVVVAFVTTWFRIMAEKEARTVRRSEFTKHIELMKNLSSYQLDRSISFINANIIPSSHCTVFYFGSVETIKTVLQQGILLDNNEVGVTFTTHLPHQLSTFEKEYFKSTAAFVVYSVQRRFLQQAEKEEESSSLCVLPSSVIIAMRGTYFDDLVAPQLWQQGKRLLSPRMIQAAYSNNIDGIEEDFKIAMKRRRSFMGVNLKYDQLSSSNDESGGFVPSPHIVHIQAVEDYLQSMSRIRKECSARNLVPIFYYTHPDAARVIMNTGFKMSKQGHGQGGVYFNVMSPSNYKINSPEYEENVLKSCFGKQFEEHKGKHKVDACLVYGVDPMLLEKVFQENGVPNENEVMIPRQLFLDFCLPREDGNYFLSKDGFMGAFRFSGRHKPTSNILFISDDTGERGLVKECELDLQTQDKINNCLKQKEVNELLIKTKLISSEAHIKLENACNFTPTKFITTFETISSAHVTETHILVFHYATIAKSEKYLRSGLPAKAEHGGILFTTHQPAHLTSMEETLFGHFEAFLVCSLPRCLLRPFHAGLDGVFVLPTQSLRAMRSEYFGNLLDPRPWLNGFLLLPPLSIIRAYQVVEEDSEDEEEDYDEESKSRIEFDGVPLIISPNSTTSPLGSGSFDFGNTGVSDKGNNADFLHIKTVSPVVDLFSYLDKMQAARQWCADRGLTPVYHFTSSECAPFMIKKGFRMSTQGQGDGGVYFSLIGPASYDLGNILYETNIITDCFGKERLEEYRGKGKLDVCFVYGIDPMILRMAPGGRENAVMVEKELFECLSLPHSDKFYYLRPSNIVAAMYISPTQQLDVNDEDIRRRLDDEKLLDLNHVNSFKGATQVKCTPIKKQLAVPKKKVPNSPRFSKNESTEIEMI